MFYKLLFILFFCLSSIQIKAFQFDSKKFPFLYQTLKENLHKKTAFYSPIVNLLAMSKMIERVDSHGYIYYGFAPLQSPEVLPKVKNKDPLSCYERKLFNNYILAINTLLNQNHLHFSLNETEVLLNGKRNTQEIKNIINKIFKVYYRVTCFEVFGTNSKKCKF